MASGNRLIAAATAVARRFSPEGIKRVLRRPVIVVSSPRAGSNLLFEALSKAPGLWTIGGESHGIFRAFPGLYAENRNLDSGSLGSRHADRETRRLMRACFLCLALDHRGKPYLGIPPARRPPGITLLEKTPRNALNIPFLLEVFPNARFLYLHRDARQNIASIIEAWRVGLQTGRFVTYRDLPGWDREAWCFVLPRGWRSMIGRPLEEIAAFQWASSNDAILDDLAALPPARWLSVDYRELTEAPSSTLSRICSFADIEKPSGIAPGESLPLSRTTLTPPDPQKWRIHERAIDRVLPDVSATIRRIEAVADQRTG